MDGLDYALESVLAFIEKGGTVQWWIVATTLLMWSLILERGVYLVRGHREQKQRVMESWFARSERHSWHAHQIRKKLISETHTLLHANMPLTKTLVAICPLMGLLGTVVGMIEVFDVMKLSGNGNVRALAAGVSEATITTMAGMVAAISGIFATTPLDRYARNERRRMEDALSTEDGLSTD